MSVRGGGLEALVDGLRIVSSGVCQYRVDPRAAATMFSLNLGQFRHNDEVQRHIPESELDALARERAARRQQGGDPIEWGLRPLVIGA